MSILNWASARPLRHISRATAMHAIFHMLLSPWISSNKDIRPLSRGYLQVRKNSTLTLQLAWALPAYATCQPKGNALSILRISPKRCQRHDCSRELRLCLLQMGAACSSSQALPSSHRPTGKSFWKGGARGGRTFFQKGFPPCKLFFLQISRPCQPSPKQKIPGGAGTKKDPLALRAARGSRTIFGSGLLSHMTLCSIIGDGELNFRVRNGVGCTLSSMATKEIWQIY